MRIVQNNLEFKIYIIPESFNAYNCETEIGVFDV